MRLYTVCYTDPVTFEPNIEPFVSKVEARKRHNALKLKGGMINLQRTDEEFPINKEGILKAIRFGLRNGEREEIIEETVEEKEIPDGPIDASFFG